MMSKLFDSDYVKGFENGCASMQAKLNAQAEELAALRKLLTDVVESERICDTDLCEMGLIDENCSLVPMLTGVKE